MLKTENFPTFQYLLMYLIVGPSILSFNSTFADGSKVLQWSNDELIINNPSLFISVDLLERTYPLRFLKLRNVVIEGLEYSVIADYEFEFIDKIVAKLKLKFVRILN